MARADIVTWLALDEFAQIIGLNPLYFAGFSSASFPNNVCGDVFFQYDWQHSDRLGRETIAMAIQQAEKEMAQEAGFNLMPDWTVAERIEYPKPGMPGVVGMDGRNPRGFLKSVEAGRGHLISGGIKTKALLQAGVVVNRSDLDGDGYAETCTVSCPVTFTGIDEVRIYYSTKSGADAWEIRPATVSISAGAATILFKSWQIPAWEKLEYLNVSPLDADTAANYEATVDVYRVYNDPSTQLQFLWEGTPDTCCGTCVACQFSSQAGCFHLRDPRLGMLVPAPGSWNASTQTFDSAEWSACREPDQVRLWYISGYIDDKVARPYVELAPYWKYAVAYFACSKFERAVCGCSNVNQFVEKWRRDGAFTSQQEGGFTMTAELAANRLGTSMGALYAYRRIHQNGMRVNK
jgi:hypothetical protein